MDFLNEMKAKSVEVIAALVLIVVGVVVTTNGAGHGDEPSELPLLILGGVATTFGGVLLSWEAGKIVSRREAMEEIRAQLDLVSRNLGQAAGQIIRTVEQSQMHEMHISTGLALVSQSTNIVYAQVNAIQNILGDRFNANDLLETASELDALAKQLERKGGDTDRVREKLSRLTTELRDRAPASSARSEVETSCPYCGTDNSVQLGVNGGDTATKTCDSCGARFNIHRRVDGSFFTREITSAAHQTSTTVAHYTCPQCAHADSLVVPEGVEKPIVCPECGRKLKIRPDGSMVDKGENLEVSAASPTGRFGSGGFGAKPTVRCPRCQKELRCVLKSDDRFAALHDECGLLLRVTAEDFQAWREAHEPETIHR
jgi:transcription elongation factor Elf1